MENHIGEMPVFEMVEVVAVFVHLAPYAVGLAVLHIYVGIQTGFGESGFDIVGEYFETFALCGFIAGNQCGKLIVFVGTAEAETEILELGLDIVEAETVGKRSVEIIRLAGDFHLLVRAH